MWVGKQISFSTGLSPSLTQEATAVYNKFKHVFTLFANCHLTYNQPVVSKEKVQELGKCARILIHAHMHGHTHTHTLPSNTERSIVNSLGAFRAYFSICNHYTEDAHVSRPCSRVG